MDQKNIGEISWGACDTGACFEIGEITTGQYAGDVALRFTGANPNDAIVGTRQELVDLVLRAKTGKLDYLLTQPT